jgi:DNA-directed RNA polymerase specialized sigma24 family protein
MTEHETVELVQRAATGDELAWRLLVDQFGPLLCQISSTYRLDEAEAPDAVATAWFKLGQHIGSLRDACAVQGWLATTVRRSAWRESAYAVASGPWPTSELSAVLPVGRLLLG